MPLGPGREVGLFEHVEETFWATRRGVVSAVIEGGQAGEVVATGTKRVLAHGDNRDMTGHRATGERHQTWQATQRRERDNRDMTGHRATTERH